MVKKAKKKTKSTADFKKRDVLWTPWRYGYIKGARSEKPASSCVFCDALETGSVFESLILDVSKHSAIILNKYPYNNGHTMVIPKRHTGDLSELPQEEFADLQLELRRAYVALRKAYDPHGFNLGMNLGRSGGAGISEHIHYHLVPRWNGDTNFMPLIAGTKVISEPLEQTYEKLKPYLKDSSKW